jgi:hypothetical protein
VAWSEIDADNVRLTSASRQSLFRHVTKPCGGHI